MSRYDAEQRFFDGVRDWGIRNPLLDKVFASAIWAAVFGVLVVFPAYCLIAAVSR